MEGETPRGAEACPRCGFVYRQERYELAPSELVKLAARLAAFVRGVSDEPASAAVVGIRPEPDVWSVMEYACHVRDVLLAQRERLLMAILEDDPSMPSSRRDQRVVVDGYAREDPRVVAGEIEVAAALCARSLGRVAPELRQRTYRVSSVSHNVAWLAQQTLHEVGHHLLDMHDVLEALAAAD